MPRKAPSRSGRLALATPHSAAATNRRLVVIRHEPDGRVLAGRAYLAHAMGVSEMTIRRHCRPVDHDPETRAALYDSEQVERVLDQIRPRRDLVTKDAPNLCLT